MFEVTYHHKIPDDISVLASVDAKNIQKAIEEKLTTKPEFFGKPLQFSLKGMRSMRVGNYRVIFKLSKTFVHIVLIEHRSVVYKTLLKRI
jgi:mRNA-degrading endonuclease RelE of RelBE toxin-antitoxin system